MKRPWQNLIQRREAWLARRAAAGNFIKGSVTCICRTCGRARCICAKKSAAQAYRLPYKDSRQKTQIVYIPRNRLPEMKRWIANNARVRALVLKIIETNIALFKLPMANTQLWAFDSSTLG
jgi:hypothetical protein